MSLPLPVAEAVSTVSSAPVPVERIAEKPRLTLVPSPVPVCEEKAPECVDPMNDMATLLQTYKAQTRECWLCSKIAGAIESGKVPSEDDKWHFTSCVLSWANLPTP